MPSHPQWPELLEEQAYLAQMLSEVAHDPGALEHTYSLLEVLRADLRTCTMQLADLEREKRESSPKHHSSAPKLYHRVATSIHSDKEKKHGLGEDEKQDRLLAAWTTKRTIGTEVKNLEGKAQFLRRQKRHHDEFQRRLVALHARTTEEWKAPSREEDEAEEDLRRAQHALYEVQKTLDRHKTLEALLRHGDYALINAGRHLTVGGSGGSPGVDSAKRCAVQTSVVVDQARRLDPPFFEQEDAEVLKAGWLREVFQATSTDDSQPPPLLQALKPHHMALLSLISRAHKRASDCAASVRRAAHQSSTARAQRDALKRQVLVTWASAEVERGGELSLAIQGLEEDGLAMLKDITAGLEVVIPIAGTQRSSVAVSPPRVSEERQRVGQDEPVSRPSPVISQALTPQASRQLLASKLTPPPTSSPLSTPPSGSDPRDHARRSADTKLRQSAPAALRPPSVDRSPPQLSAACSIRQPKPIHKNNRHPVLEHQYDQEWHSKSGLQPDGGPSSQPQRQPPPITSDRGEVIIQSQSQPFPGQPFVQGPQPSPPSFIPMRPAQQTATSLQPPAPHVPRASADVRPLPSPSIQNIVSRAAEHRHTLPTIPQSQPIRPLPQVIKTPSYQSDSPELKPSEMSPPSSAQLGRPDLQTASGFSPYSPGLMQATTALASPSMATLSSQRPATHSILKQTIVPTTPRPSTAVDADPWGVKVAAATPSRPQPKLKTMFNLLRGNEGSKNTESDASRTRVAPQQEEQPALLPKKPNPRTAMQTVRFSENVEIIPRPAVDSEPSDDEEEDDLPPSPKRGSSVWLRCENEDMIENSDDSSGDVSDMELRPNAAEGPVNTAFAVDSSQSSSSSAPSSSYLTEHSASSALSSSTTPPSSVTSPHTSNWLGGARFNTMSPEDLRYGQPVIGHAVKEDKASHDDQHVTGTRSQNADKGRLMSLSGPNVDPTDNPIPSSYTHNSSRQTRHGRTQSDHELLQAIFPSPAQSSISRTDLIFTA